jgi:hypothetical protein
MVCIRDFIRAYQQSGYRVFDMCCGIFHITQTNLFLFMLDTLAVKANKRAVVWVCTRGWYGELKLLRD